MTETALTSDNRTITVTDNAVAEACAHLLNHNEGQPTLIICRDTGRMEWLKAALKFFAPHLNPLLFPAWDTSPYDRISPSPNITAERLSTLNTLINHGVGANTLIITTSAALIQKIPPKRYFKERALNLKSGQSINMHTIMQWLMKNGYNRVSVVREPGDYAVRGGIVDLFPPASPDPFRLDFFGDQLETLRKFDAETQKTTRQIEALELIPAREFVLDGTAIKTFRQTYVETFGGHTRGDTLYEAVSEGRLIQGMEHWLSFFHGKLDTVLSLFPKQSHIIFEPLAQSAIEEKYEEIQDAYAARQAQTSAEQSLGMVYKPAPIDDVFLSAQNIAQALESFRKTHFVTEREADKTSEIWKEKPQISHYIRGRDFLTERQKHAATISATQAAEKSEPGLYDAVINHIQALQKQKKHVLITAHTEPACERLKEILKHHGLKLALNAPDFAQLSKTMRQATLFAVVPLSKGYETQSHAIMTEDDILGERLNRNRRKKSGKDVITEAATLSVGDIVVHADHGIGRFVGLKTLQAAGTRHDCLELHYAKGDKLFLPVENIELLSRYGNEDSEVQLDGLGTPAWQVRKAKMKQRVREIAAELMKIAAARILKKAPAYPPPDEDGALNYQEFVARFPYTPTQDQLGAIDDVEEDLLRERPMDRLVCGDVGFGKTEVAMRAAFLAATNGAQVAIVVPTTLLARQHAANFRARFEGLPITVSHASRLVSAKEMREVKQGLKAGTVDIVIGTHALLAKTIEFKNLGLLIIDEEQHFGVKHKERLKQLSENVHVLTLTATPIPRTLQMALTGVRDLSIIASPPIDRLAVRTAITPFDPISIREALLREKYRGGQAFYVCPRIDDIDEIASFLREKVPEVSFQIGHGQMNPTDLDDIMTNFYDGKFDVLLATTIIESGIDVPRANTLIIHRADMFGLAQLYQIRGRVGRSKLRGYALLTLPAKKQITRQAEKRLNVLHTLDTLGAGFQLASHDLDIRGAGNLVGDEQSGHIKEVGFELYQQMLTEAIAIHQAGIEALPEEEWSPTINIGTSVLIPESYIDDLSLRLQTYRQLADLKTREDIEDFARDLTDRFGKYPVEVEQLLELTAIKQLCLRAHIEKVDVGDNAIVIAFRNNTPPNPDAVFELVRKEAPLTKIRPDQKISMRRTMPEPAKRFTIVRDTIARFAAMATQTTDLEKPKKGI